MLFLLYVSAVLLLLTLFLGLWNEAWGQAFTGVALGLFNNWLVVAIISLFSVTAGAVVAELIAWYLIILGGIAVGGLAVYVGISAITHLLEQRRKPKLWINGKRIPCTVVA
jgi:hypothetical protein